MGCRLGGVYDPPPGRGLQVGGRWTKGGGTPNHFGLPATPRQAGDMRGAKKLFRKSYRMGFEGGSGPGRGSKKRVFQKLSKMTGS